jgi:hypothetical protein
MDALLSSADRFVAIHIVDCLNFFLRFPIAMRAL